MKIDKKTIGVLVLLVAVLAVIVFVDKETSPESPSLFDTGQTEDKTNDSETEESDSDTGDSNGIVGSESGTDGISTGDSEDSNFSSLPEDINESECGIYYEEYGVCTGTCPEGECVSEGRSCFCRKTE